MDQLFLDLIGKPHNPPKIITIVAENFQILEDQAKFLKAVLAIPALKRLSHLLEPISKTLIQFGPLHSELESMLRQDKWVIDIYSEESVCDKMADNFPPSVLTDRGSLVFVNDASRFLLLEHDDPSEQLKFLRLIDKWKRCHGYSVIVLFQQSCPATLSNFLRHLMHISDAYVTTSSHRHCYMQSIWFQPAPTEKTLLPPLIETQYYTAKIGKSDSAPSFLCFQDVVRVSKNHDPDLSDRLTGPDRQDDEQPSSQSTFERLILDEDEDESATTVSTLPYIRAQNPEESRIFYYPDKDDDIDEDDPDEDLDI